MEPEDDGGEEPGSRARPHGPSTDRGPRLSGLVPPPPASSLPEEPLVGRLLVVDDDEPLARALERLLRARGHSVLRCGDGASALAMLDQHPIDLVLLDMIMPGLGGCDVLARIKSNPAVKDVPVVMISGIDDLEAVVRCLELGADDYLLKPVKSELLRARVDTSLQRKFARDQEGRYRALLEVEAQRADRLLHAIFPAHVIEELKLTRTVRPRIHEDVTVLFCDVVGFTVYCDTHTPEEVVDGVSRMVDVQEQICARHQLEKIKTIGDALLATAGLLGSADDGVERCVRAGEEMIAAIREVEPHWQVRVGLHVGPVMAGVVGHRQYLFDIWGDTVNTAARVQSLGRPDAVTLSAAAFARLPSPRRGRSLGEQLVKGKGRLELFSIDSAE